MPYGRIKIDTVIFTDGGSDRSIVLSGLVNLVSGSLSATGALNVDSVTANTISGTDISGTSLTVVTATATTGNFTSQVSSALVTGTTIQATSLTGVSGTFTTVSSNFVNAGTGTFRRINVPSGTVQAQTLESTNQITGLVVNSNNGNFTDTLTAATFEATVIQNTNKITAETGIFTTNLSGTLITGNKVQATTGHFSTTTVDGPSTFNSQLTVTEKLTSATGVFTAVLSGQTVTGTTAKFTSVTGQNGYYTNTLFGQTVTGAQGKFNTLTGNVISGGTGVFNQITGQTIQVPSLDLASGNFTNLSGGTITGNAGQFTTLTGKTVNATSGFFNYISGTTLDIPSFTVNSGTFTNLSGQTITGDVLNVTSGQFNTITVDAPSTFNTTLTVNQQATIQTGVFPQLLSGALVTGDAGRFTNLTGVNGNFTTQVFSTTVSGTTGKFNTVTGNRVEAATGIFGTISGTTLQLPSITTDSGIYNYLSGAVITGNAGQFNTFTGRVVSATSGLFSYISGTTIESPSLSNASGTFTFLSGGTITGDLLNVTSGHFNTITVDAPSTFNTQLTVNQKLTAVTGSFTTATGVNLSFTNITGTTGTFTQTVSGLVVTGNAGRFTVVTGQTVTGVSGKFSTVSGNTVTGNTVRGTSGVYTNLSGQTITGNTLNVTSGTFDRIVINNAFNTVTSATGIFTSLLSGQLITGHTVNTVSGIFDAVSVGAPSTFNTNLTVNQTLTAATGVFTAIERVNVLSGGSAALPAINISGSTRTNGIYKGSNDSLSVVTSGVAHINISPKGYVGIGDNVDPEPYNILANNLVISGSSNEGLTIVPGELNAASIHFTRPDKGVSAGITANPFLRNINVFTDGFIRATITSGGFLGLGTTSPNKILHLSSSDPIIQFTDTDTAVNSQFGIVGDDLYISNDFTAAGASPSIQFWNTGTERLRITSAGSVGIGTTTPETQLDISGGNQIIRGDGSTSFLEIGKGATGNQFAYVDFVGDTTYTDYGLRLIRDNNGPNSESRLEHRGTGSLTLGTNEAAPIKFATASTERLSVTSDGYLRFVSGSSGVQFNADTAAANALNDYEEGTWTPTIQGSSLPGSATYTAQNGIYTKIGDTVVLTCRVTWNSHTGTGLMRLTGLPYSTNNPNFEGAASIYFDDISTMAANSTLALAPQGTFLGMLTQTFGPSGSRFNLNISNSGQIFLTFVYRAL